MLEGRGKGRPGGLGRKGRKLVGALFRGDLAWGEGPGVRCLVRRTRGRCGWLCLKVGGGRGKESLEGGGVGVERVFFQRGVQKVSY